MFPSAATRPPGILHHPRPVLNPTPKLGFHASRNGLCDSPTFVRKHGGSIGVRCESAGQQRDDGYYMRRCVDLARTAVGHTSPNPMVGCVIVKDGNVVGEGFHPKAGQPHAEVFALRDAGDLAENATAYVSLEPCNHFGRTPPCTEALIKAKVKKVVVGMVDPNPIVASKGVDRLRNAGINVMVGVEGELCKKLNEAYIHQMLTGKPLVALRYSLSVNGCLLDRLGEGVMEAGGYFSKLLKEYDAIIISPTSFGDSFSLSLSQEPGANQPLQVIVARNPSSPIQIPALTNEAISKVIILTDNQAAVGPNIAQRGVETVILDRMDLGMVLDYCKRRGLCSVLLDLRGNSRDFIELLKEGMDQNLIQKFIMEILPLWDDDKESNGRRHVKDIVFSTKLSSHSILLEGYL